MRKVLPVLLALVLCLPPAMSQNKKEEIQQVTIVSKREKLSDILTKTMKVVLPGEDVTSLALRDAVKNAWSLSPYEFCSVNEFRRLMKDDRFYFMFIAGARKDDGISYLRISKGGAEDIDSMLEAVSFPLCPADGGSGREGAYMPAIISVVQDYVEKALNDGFKGMGNVSAKVPEGMRLILDEEDLVCIDGKTLGSRLGSAEISGEKAAEAMRYGAARTVVGYTISPAEPKDGAVCYKFLFNARTHELYYFRKHRISPSKGKGFLKGDIRHITAAAGR